MYIYVYLAKKEAVMMRIYIGTTKFKNVGKKVIFVKFIEYRLILEYITRFKKLE